MTPGIGDHQAISEDGEAAVANRDGLPAREAPSRWVAIAGEPGEDAVVLGLREIDRRLEALREQLAAPAMRIRVPVQRSSAPAREPVSPSVGQRSSAFPVPSPVSPLPSPVSPAEPVAGADLGSPVLAAISQLRTDPPTPGPVLPTAAQLAAGPTLATAAPQAPPASIALLPPPEPAGAPTAAPVAVETEVLALPAPPGDVRPRSHTRGGWIGSAIRKLASTDAAMAGRVIIGLLPIQGDVIADVVSYDLVIAGGRCHSVTVTEEETTVRRGGQPRPLETVDGRIATTLSGLGAVPTAGRLRGRSRPSALRLEGRRRRKALSAFREVIEARVSLSQARAAGADLDGELLLALIAAGLPPQWTIGHRFTIEFVTEGAGETNKRLYLRVNDGHLLSMSAGLPLDVPSTTVTCRPDELVSVITGDGTASDAMFAGKRAPLMLLQGWMTRLESGRG